MALTVSRRRGARFVHQCLHILVSHPDGITPKDLFRGFDTTAWVPEIRLEDNPALFVNRLAHFFSLRAAPLVRAGWLTWHANRWIVTDDGRVSYARFQDPDELLREAGRRSLGGRAAARFPRVYELLARVWYQLRLERYFIKRIGLSALARNLVLPSPWRRLLPMQRPLPVTLPHLRLRSLADLLAYLQEATVPYAEGGNTVYLSPTALKSSRFASLMTNYPPDAGLKIVKNPGSLAETSYIHATQTVSSRLHLRMTHGLGELSLVALLLHSRDLGPHLYDLVEMRCAEQVWSAFVVQHVSGRGPTTEECETAMAAFRGLQDEGILAVTLPYGYEDEDLTCPGCNGNALTDGKGRFRYLDFQNFLLLDYGSYVGRVAQAWGDERARREAEKDRQATREWRRVGMTTVENAVGRAAALQRLLDEIGASMAGRVVLDLGGDPVTMIASCLRAGARWCHGWDLPGRVRQTEKVLMALGCTRFSMTGAEATDPADPEHDLPSFLEEGLKGCVIVWGADHDPRAWAERLRRLPWSLMILEGGAEESREAFSGRLEELRHVVTARVGALGGRDGRESVFTRLAVLLHE